MMTYTKAQYIK